MRIRVRGAGGGILMAEYIVDTTDGIIDVLLWMVSVPWWAWCAWTALWAVVLVYLIWAWR